MLGGGNAYLQSRDFGNRRQISMFSSNWSTEQVSGQPGLHEKPCVEKSNKGILMLNALHICMKNISESIITIFDLVSGDREASLRSSISLFWNMK